MMASLRRIARPVAVFVMIAQMVTSVTGQGSEATCQRCENHPQSCRRIAGLYTMTVLTKGGYHPVVDIPPNACNLNITELAPSKNYLALKTSRGDNIFNSYWSVGSTGRVRGAGTIISFKRGVGECPGLCVTAPGPTNRALVVQLLYYYKNPGIAYSFVLPKDVAFQPFDSSAAGEPAPAPGLTSPSRSLAPSALPGSPSRSRSSASSQEPRRLSPGSRRIIPRTSAAASSRRRLSRQRAAAIAAAAAGRESDVIQNRRNGVVSPMSQGARQGGVGKIDGAFPSAGRPAAIPASSAAAAGAGYHYRGRSYGSHTLGGRGQSYSSQYPNGSSSGGSSGGGAGSLIPNSVDSRSLLPNRRPGSGRTVDGQNTPSSGSVGGLIPNSVDSRSLLPNRRPGSGRTVDGQNTPSSGSVGGLIPNSVDSRSLLPNRRAGSGRTVDGQNTPSSGSVGGLVPNSVDSRSLLPNGRAGSGRTVDGQNTPSSGNVGGLIPKSVDNRSLLPNRRAGSGRTSSGQYTPSQGSLIRSGARYDVNSSRRPGQPRPSLSRRPTLRREPPPAWHQPQSPSVISAYDTEGARGLHSLSSSGRSDVVDRSFLQRRPVDNALQRERPRPLGPRPALTIASGGGGKGYEWTISGLSECSRTCGGGVQETEVVCVLTSAERQVVVTPDNCLNSLKPKQQRLPCNNDPCPPAWETEDWSECSVTCGGGTQNRRVECRQRFSDSLQLSVSASQCNQTGKPAVAQQCNNDPCARWKEGQWDECSAECGGGERRRTMDCVDGQGVQIPASFCPGDQPAVVERCDSQPCHSQWWHSHWSDQCSATCGTGITSRHVLCADRRGQPVPEVACAGEKRPHVQKRCDSDVVCGGIWFAGPWSECSDSCGRGVRRRQVVCLQKKEGGSGVVGRAYVTAPPSQCREETRPVEEEACQRRDCGPQYYMTPWSECSVTCGHGIRTRQVRCLDENQQPSRSCERSHAPKNKEKCQLSPCPERKSGRRHSQSQSGVTDSRTAEFSSSVHVSPSDDDVYPNSRRYQGRRAQHVQAMQDSGKAADNKEQSSAAGSQQQSSHKCQDTFLNCRLVVQARLCPHSYYKGVCCASCGSHH